MYELTELLQLIGVPYDGPSITVSALNTLSDAHSYELSFLQNKKYIDQLRSTTAGAVFVTEDMKENVPSHTIAIVVEDPYMALAYASKLFAPALLDESAPEAVVGEGSVIAEGANLAKGSVVGKNCTIMPGAYIGRGASVGDNSIIHSNVSLYHECVVGSDCIIHANSVIGSDGFGFATSKQGEHTKLYQNGNVVIEDDVELGAGVTIDRAVFGSTRIKKGVRMDNLIHIGHNCEIGEYSVLVAQSGVAGSTKLGRNVVVGGQSAFAGHLEVAPFTNFAARSGITKSITESGKTFGGFPLMEQKQWLKLQVKIARLLKS